MKINGVSYNIAAIQKMTKDQFMSLPVHAINLKKIVKEKRAAALEEVWNILSSKFAKDGSNKLDGNGAKDRTTESKGISNSRTSRNRNAGILPVDEQGPAL